MYYAFHEDNDDPLELNDSHHVFMFTHMIPVFKTILSEIITDLLSTQNISDLNNSTITNVNGTVVENFNIMNFYQYLAFEGLHNTPSYITDITNNPIETIKHAEYNRYARTSSKDCQ